MENVNVLSRCASQRTRQPTTPPVMVLLEGMPRYDYDDEDDDDEDGDHHFDDNV